MDKISDLLNPAPEPSGRPRDCGQCKIAMEARRRGAGFVWVCPRCCVVTPDDAPARTLAGDVAAGLHDTPHP